MASVNVGSGGFLINHKGRIKAAESVIIKSDENTIKIVRLDFELFVYQYKQNEISAKTKNRNKNQAKY
jgi:hypothetical protein